MEVGVAGIQVGNVGIAQVVPADVVDRAARQLAELTVERGLDQVLDGLITRNAVVDDEEA